MLTLDNVYFPAIWPGTFRTQGPEGRPCAASLGHVRQVENYHRVAMSCIGDDADTSSTARAGGNGIGCIDTHDKLVVGG